MDNVEALVGTWEFVRGDNMDAFLKEMGVGKAIRMVATRMSPRFIISQKDGNWTLRTEMPIKTSSVTFTPGVEFADSTPDGQEVTKLIRFENGRWIETTTRKDGKESVSTRQIDHDGLQKIEMTTGAIKVQQWFKRKE